MSNILPLLAIDAGNTRIKWGLHDGRGWAARAVGPTSDAAMLEAAWAALPRPAAAIASNVAGEAVRAQLEKACAARGVELRVIRAAAHQQGVVNGYREPAQLGADRWAALVAAHRSDEGHKLIVNAGTALTVDALASDGRFLGGLIVPGPALMRRSLDKGTAALRMADGEVQDFPASTADAIASGAAFACAGAVIRMRDAMAMRNAPPSLIVLSGGAAREIAPHLPIAFTIRENLVLDGLVLIARNG